MRVMHKSIFETNVFEQMSLGVCSRSGESAATSSAATPPHHHTATQPAATQPAQPPPPHHENKASRRRPASSHIASRRRPASSHNAKLGPIRSHKPAKSQALYPAPFNRLHLNKEEKEQTGVKDSMFHSFLPNGCESFIHFDGVGRARW